MFVLRFEDSFVVALMIFGTKVAMSFMCGFNSGLFAYSFISSGIFASPVFVFSSMFK